MKLRLQSIRDFINRFPLAMPLFVLIFFSVKCYSPIAYIANSDLPYYFHIAQDIVQNSFYDSINAYWSPLYAWLLLPIVQYKAHIIDYCYALNVCNMVLLLWLCNKIFKRMQINTTLTQIALCIISSYFIQFFFVRGPDTILVTLLSALFYCSFTIQDFLKHKYVIGFVGVLLYLSKAYCFYFFLAFLLVKFLHFRFSNSTFYKEISIAFTKTLLIFLIGSCTWISILFWKYQKLQISSVGSYAHAIAAPNCTSAHDLESAGLLTMPFAKSKTFADELSISNAKKDWSAFANLENCRKQLFIVRDNLLAWLKIVYKNQLFICILFVLPFLLFVFSKKLKVTSNAFAHFSIFYLLFLAGYLLVSFEFRHFFMLLIVHVLFVTYLIQHCNWQIFKNLYAKSFLLITIGINCIYPIYAFCNAKPSAQKCFNQIQFIKKVIPDNKNIAYQQMDEDIFTTLSLSSNIKIFGLINAYTDSTALLTALHDKQIEYVLINKTAQNTHYYYKNYKPTFSFYDLYIYRCKP